MPPTATSDDHHLAHRIAGEAAERLSTLQQTRLSAGHHHYDVELAGDRQSHDWILEELTAARPDDAVLSEEGDDSDERRLVSARTWVVDPLDGSSSFGWGSPEWAVHVALVVDGVAVAGAVASPGVGVVASTHLMPTTTVAERKRPILVVGRTRARNDGSLIATALDAEVIPCSSAGFKAALVITGKADVYVHSSPLYEWDVCAPAIAASAAGLDVSDPAGNELEFNKPHPTVPGLVISRPRLTAPVLAALRKT